jgi:hypothetical protein
MMIIDLEVGGLFTNLLVNGTYAGM